MIRTLARRAAEAATVWLVEQVPDRLVRRAGLVSCSDDELNQLIDTERTRITHLREALAWVWECWGEAAEQRDAARVYDTTMTRLMEERDEARSTAATENERRRLAEGKAERLRARVRDATRTIERLLNERDEARADAQINAARLRLAEQMLERALRERDEARAHHETAMHQLTACGCIALGYTKPDEITREHPAWSASLGDMLQMKRALESERDTAIKERDEARATVERVTAQMRVLEAQRDTALRLAEADRRERDEARAEVERLTTALTDAKEWWQTEMERANKWSQRARDTEADRDRLAAEVERLEEARKRYLIEVEQVIDEWKAANGYDDLLSAYSTCAAERNRFAAEVERLRSVLMSEGYTAALAEPEGEP